MVEMLWALSSGVQQLELESQDCLGEEDFEVELRSAWMGCEWVPPLHEIREGSSEG